MNHLVHCLWLRAAASFVAAAAIGIGPPIGASASDAVVTFNEVYYHPAGDGEAEWIELHNQMSIRVDLSGWRLSGGVEFEFPEGTVIGSKAHVFVQGVGAAMENALGPFAGRLDNGGETITLRDRNHRVMDRLDYGDRSPWPAGPDGSGMTLAKRRPQLATAEPASWGTSRTAGGSPGSVNLEFVRLGDLVLSEIRPGFVELGNRSHQLLQLAGYQVRNGSGKRLLLGEDTLAAGEFRSLETTVAQVGATVFLLDAEGDLLDAVPVPERHRGRRQGESGWHFTEAPTPGAPNRVTLREDIVINEIMYHFPPLYDQPDTVDNEYTPRNEEWVELYNRSEDNIDLSGWKLDAGIHYEFPQATTLAPDSYLVVAREAAALREKYPQITVLGDYEGKLSNSSDTIALRDALGNVADRVRYYDSGRWPRWADGGGSSLQLLDPWADNAVAEAWQASDEGPLEWAEFRYQGSGAEPVRSNNPGHFHEFLMGLLGAGEAMVASVSVIEDPEGEARELLVDGDFQRRNIFTGQLTHWRTLGTHADSRPESYTAGLPGFNYLRLVADGPIEHTYNNASSTFPSGHRVDATKTYAISFKAKWVKGSPLLNTRLYLNRLSRTHVLPIPDHLGTPGAGTSHRNIGPTMKALRVHPLAQQAIEPVTVTVRARDPQGISEMKLAYRPSGGGWQTVAMQENEGVYTGRIPGHPNGTILQFYLSATDGAGALSKFPAKGRDSRALLRFGRPREGSRAVNHLRLLMLPEEHDSMRRPEHVASNGRVGGTLVANGEDYHFDVGVRLRNSPYGRRGNRTGYNVLFGKQHPYRGVHDSIAIDRGAVMPNGNSNGFLEVKAGAGVNELIANQIAQRARGIPTTYDDVIFIETPNTTESSLAQLRMARYGAIYLDSQYENGAQGSTHKFELIYHPTGTVDGRPDGLKAPYTRVRGVDIQNMRDDKEAYRFNFIPTNNRDRDDFTGIIRLGDALSSRTDALSRERIPEAIDVDQWMRTFAFQSLIGVADTYNMGLHHNLVLYTRPSDGRVLAFPWDLDHAFYYSPNSDLLGRGGTNLARFINLPENKRLFYGHLHDIIQTAYNTEAMAPWIDHLNHITGHHHDQRFLAYIRDRGNFVQRELKKTVSNLFQITTNRGSDFETDAPSVVLQGNGWVNLRAIRNETTGQMLKLIWTGVNTWQAELPLALGQNETVLQGVDFQGSDIGSFFSPGSDTITVTHTGSVEAAAKGNLIISEIYYHPANDPGEAEFLELQNVGPHSVDLTGIRFTRGVRWEAAESTVLPPGAIMLVRDFGSSRLSNGGETLRLEDRAGGVIQELRYEDEPPWPEGADGAGYSMVFRGGDPVDPFSWRESMAPGGSPGADERNEFGGETSFALYAFGKGAPLQVNGQLGLTLSYHSTADDLAWTLETSEDLTAWKSAHRHVRFIDRRTHHASRQTILTWKTDPTSPFYRLRYSHNPRH